MSERDAPEPVFDPQVLESLPELGPGESFVFACNGRAPCFNVCCADLTMPLSPYDVLRLRRKLGISGERFLNEFAELLLYPDTGFPLPLLKMLDGPDARCPFVTPAGCSVYEDRSAACRAYPLGRGTRPGPDGTVRERFFLVREEHCRGFDAGAGGTARTAEVWFGEQGMAPYNRSNDRYMRIMAGVRAGGRPVSKRMASMCLLAFFRLDRFRDFIRSMNLLDKMELSAERRDAVLGDEEARLDFAFDWTERVLFGDAEASKRKERPA
jgi:Fe-S-cluster containining protein